MLVADDQKDYRDVVQYILETSGYEVTVAADGAAAIALATRQRFDLVILDLVMSGLSGLDVLDRMQSMPQDKRMPVLILSGHEEAAREAVRRGANGFLLKPFNRNRFIDVVLQLLEMERRARPRT